MSERRKLPARRGLITQKVRIAGKRTLYISVHDHREPAELFLRVRGMDCLPETIALYDVVARLASLALQHGASVESVAGMLLGTKYEPAGPVCGHGRIKNCTSLTNLIGRHLLVEVCHRDDLAHVPPLAEQAHGAKGL